MRVEEAERISTGVPELDRVLGGGLVPASLVLVGGEPGVGKSTLLLTALGAIARSGRRALLVTGEESAAQVKLRAARLGGAEAVEILAETELDAVCATLEARAARRLRHRLGADALRRPSSARRPARSRRCARPPARLLRVAKEAGVATFLVGHVTKDGAVAGPRVLEHLVDCVLQFEGDRYHAHRVLRATKNRFGSTNELGVFEMTGGRPRRRARSVGALRDDARRARSAPPSPARSRGRGRSCSRSRRSSRRPISRCRAASAPASTRSGSR